MSREDVDLIQAWVSKKTHEKFVRSAERLGLTKATLSRFLIQAFADPKGFDEVIAEMKRMKAIAKKLGA